MGYVLACRPRTDPIILPSIAHLHRPSAGGGQIVAMQSTNSAETSTWRGHLCDRVRDDLGGRGLMAGEPVHCVDLHIQPNSRWALRGV
jgi:hypothetical protein